MHVRDAKEKVSMDIIHPNVPETIKRLADAYEYLVERGGARNSDGNPDSLQAAVFLATIVDVTVGS